MAAGVADSVGTWAFAHVTAAFSSVWRHRFLSYPSMCQISASEAGRMGERWVPSDAGGRAPDVWGGGRHLCLWSGRPPPGSLQAEGLLFASSSGARQGRGWGLLNWCGAGAPAGPVGPFLLLPYLCSFVSCLISLWGVCAD